MLFRSPYRLPEAPPPHIHPNYPYYPHILMNREYLLQPQVSHMLPKPPSTSYNNPHFVIPPPRHVSPIGSPMPSLSHYHMTTQQNNHFLHPLTPPPSLIPSYHHLTGHPIDSLMRWWDEDNIAQYIITSRLDTIPHGLLPPSGIVV